MSPPTGPAITFLFSDVEGSTRLAESLGHGWADVLARHRSLVRGAVADHDGMEVGTEGDSFFVVFPDAVQGVLAAIAIQRAMEAEPWPDGVAVRVRIGIHAGDARREGDDYVGVDVHRAARVMATAHGGQIVISDPVRAAIDGAPERIEVRDLGEHRLRGLTRRERLFQVVAPELPSSFPALRTVDAIPNNLPSQPTELVGRERDLASLRELLELSRARLITITGPGGIGKTRLAVQAAADLAYRFDDGAYFVDLSESRDAAGMLDRIVRALGVTVPADADAREALLAHLQARVALLVLDNFEQVMEAAPLVAELIALCPRLTLLVTSREGLRVRGERLVALSPLAVTPASFRMTAADALQSDAVRLFVVRAGEADPDFRFSDAEAGTVAEICALLDGLPLAIELAAAGVRLFSPAELRDRLHRQLDDMPAGPRDLPQRQQTLRSTIEWSYQLLSEQEQRLLEIFSVFPSARLDDIQSVAMRIPDIAGTEVVGTIAALLDKSLLRSESTDDGQRLLMLGTIRRFAAERLAEQPELAESAARAHAEHFADRAEHSSAAGASDLDAELANLEIAWQYHVARADVRRLGSLLEVLWAAYEGRGWYHSAIGLAQELLGALAATPGPGAGVDEVTLRLTLARGLLALRGYTPEVEQVYRDAVRISDDLQATSVQLPVLRSLASFYLYRGQIERTQEIAYRLLELAEAQHDARLELEGNMILGPSLAFLGDIPGGLARLQRVIDLFDPTQHRSIPLRLGPSPGVAAPVISAMMHWWVGRPATARTLTARADDMAAQLRHPYSTAYGAFHTGVLSAWRRDFDTTRRRARTVLEIAEEHDYRIWIAVGLALDGLADAAHGDTERGLARTEAGVAMYEGIHTPPVFWPVLLGLQAHACQLAGRHADALSLADQAFEVEGETSPLRVLLRIVKADVLLAQGRQSDGAEELRTAVADATAFGVPMMLVLALVRLQRIAGRREAAAERLRAVLGALEERDDDDFAEARTGAGMALATGHEASGEEPV